ncbi:MAG: hypothetical protein J6Q81_02985, partial [Lentisphaeria bacterium]|nr:hypothetical protein [Lentisphaeria bacterium]
ALKNHEEILRLAGNYRKTTPRLSFTLPGNAEKIIDATNGKKLQAAGNTVTLDIQAGKYRLIYAVLAK